MKIALIINKDKEKAIQIAARITELLSSEGAEILTDKPHDELFKECDAAVTVGGDGTIIHSAKHAAKYSKPMIGVNVGRLGFAAEVEPDNIADLKRILSNDYEIQNRMLLDVAVKRGNGETENFLAVNDATLARGQLSRIIDISVSLDSSPISTYRADGILFSTPTGSTAYALSAGGPVIYPGMSCILLTPICPHSLISRSVVFDGSAVLTAKVKVNDNTNAVLSIDGERNIELTPKDLVIIKKSDKPLKLIKLYKRNFYQHLNEKLKERKS